MGDVLSVLNEMCSSETVQGGREGWEAGNERTAARKRLETMSARGTIPFEIFTSPSSSSLFPVFPLFFCLALFQRLALKKKKKSTSFFPAYLCFAFARAQISKHGDTLPAPVSPNVSSYYRLINSTKPFFPWQRAFVVSDSGRARG